jgi:hypothetical protein
VEDRHRQTVTSADHLREALQITGPRVSHCKK